jgi:mannitol operon repressor
MAEPPSHARASREEDYNSFIEELSSETDRACAILGPAYLDARLGELIQAFLVDDPAPVQDLLSPDRPYAPLGSFAARVLAAYCLGLIDPIQHRDLQAIRRIRNLFAHGLQGMSFSDRPISARCDKLVTHRMTPFTFDAKGKFTATVMILATDIEMQAREALEARRTSPDYYSSLQAAETP